MTPVINPWVFYFMDMVNGVDAFFTIFGVMAFIGAIIATVLYFVIRCDCGADDDDTKTANWIRKLVSWVAGIFLIISTLVPSQATLTKMVIAQNVTYERVETVTDTVETVYNDIMELFESNE